MLTKQQVFNMTKYNGLYDPNPVQEAAFRPIFASDLHILVAAGTGCGKTQIYEWAIYKEVVQGRHVVLVAPQKALVEQKADAWRTPGHPLSHFSLCVKTGDYLNTSTTELVNNQIKIMTPEALAVALRNKGSENWMQLVSLLVIDEIHTIGMKSRGNGLEACVIGYFERREGCDTRVVGVSASIDDKSLGDMMQWISELGHKKVHAIRSAWRPTPLIYKFPKYEHHRHYKTAESRKATSVIKVVQSLRGKPALIFVHSKKFGYSLVKEMKEQGIDAEFHCADLNLKERKALEARFLNDLNYLVATSTLAIGCDYPVEDVIIAGVHRGLNVVEQDTLQQMAGRAGHQSSCDKGIVHQIIPDRHDDEYGQWEKYVMGTYTIRSELMKKKWLAFHTISVVSRNEVADQDLLEGWYRKTLAYVQKGDATPELMEDMIGYLIRAKAISYNETGVEFYATLLGRAAARFYFDPMDVMKWYTGMKELAVRNHAQACMILASGETLVEDLAVKKQDIPECVKYQMTKEIKGKTPSIPAQFLYYLAIFLAEDEYKKREKLPAQLRVPLPGFFKELQRVVACMKYVASQEIDLDLNLRCLEDTVLKVTYGIPDEVLDLVRIPGVGRARAIKLYEGDIRIVDDIVMRPDRVVELLGQKIGQKVIKSAELMAVPF